MSVKTLLPDLISEEPRQGGTLYKFALAGTTAWIVEPDEPLAEKKWFWVPEWPDAFLHRNGVNELLELGYYMIHIHVLGMCGNPEAVEIIRRSVGARFWHSLRGHPSWATSLLSSSASIRCASSPRHFGCLSASVAAISFGL